jgi:putative NADPH-quinone reductase
VVVSAHPPTDGPGAELVAATVGALREGGHEVRTIDLDGYEPRMTAEEWNAYRDLAPRPGPVVAAHIADVRWAEQLVFVYPTVWQGLPAVLKGWLERTMVPGVAFEVDDAGKLHGGLAVRRIVGVTTNPLPRWVVVLLGDPGRRILCRALRLSCTHPWRARCRWYALHHPHHRRPEALDGFRLRVTGALARGGRGAWRARPHRLSTRAAVVRRRRAVAGG